MSQLSRSLAAAMLVTACDHPFEPTASPDTTFAAARAPAAAGRVVRFRSGFFAFLNFDESTNLSSVIGLPDDPAASGVPFCGGPGDFEILDWQQVLHPAGSANTRNKAGAVNVHVYDGTPFNAALATGDLCAAVSLPRLAEGEARLQYTDNDFDVTGPRANSFGWRLHGVLAGPGTGGPARYLDRLQGVLRPTGAFDFTVNEVRLTPLD